MAKIEIRKAKPYKPMTLGSFDTTQNMLLTQYQFPAVFNNNLDKLIDAYHNRLFSWDYDHSRQCYEKHLKTGELAIEQWCRDSKPKQVLDFLKDILKADVDTEWTGYRITASVNVSNGYPVWYYMLFAKHPESNTKVYTGQNAPNVIQPKECYHPDGYYTFDVEYEQPNPWGGILAMAKLLNDKD